jgi:hypothetical protein
MRRQPRRALRPTLDGCLMEERVVMSASVGSLSALRNAVPAQVQAAQQATAGTLTSRQLQQNLQQQFRSAYADLQRNVSGLIQRLDTETGGRWNQQDLQALRGQIQGLNNATAYRLLALSDVIPGGQRLTNAIQRLTVDNGFGNSVDARIGRVLDNPRATGNLQSLTRSLTRELNLAQQGANYNLNQFLRGTNFNRLSYDPQTGRSVPLQQFIGQNIARQYGSGLSQLSSAFPQYTNQSLFNGTTDPTPEQLSGFNNTANAALGTLAYRLNSSLGLINGAQQALSPGLQGAFYGNSPNSFATGLTGLSGTGNDFNQAGQGLFGSLYGSTLNNLNSYFGLQNVNNPTLPSVGVPIPTLNTFNNYGGGFNGGFGTGATGFGINPNVTSGGVDPFANGFYSGISGALASNGFTTPRGTFGNFSGSGFGSNAIGGTPIGGGTGGIGGGGSGATPGNGLPGGGLPGGGFF